MSVGIWISALVNWRQQNQLPLRNENIHKNYMELVPPSGVGKHHGMRQQLKGEFGYDSHGVLAVIVTNHLSHTVRVAAVKNGDERPR